MIANRKRISLNDFVKKAIGYAVSHENDIDDTTLVKIQAILKGLESLLLMC